MAHGARNHTQCDSLLIGDRCGGTPDPTSNAALTAKIEHEATTLKIADDQLFYCRARGLSEEDAVNLIVNGFCKEVFKELPMEFAVEAQKLLAVSLEGSVGSTACSDESCKPAATSIDTMERRRWRVQGTGAERH